MPISKRLRISDPARRDLELIGEYTKREWGAVQKKKYLGQIKAGFKAICEAPNTGKIRDEIDKGLCSHPAQKHIIFYRQTENELFIVRILHQSMDMERDFD